ncbi:hypothetical protein BN1013_01431 [Candidatus Rubidus massiliensis]|nr:MAG: hypothetical protein BGO10_04545 [Chlamydia sp. 32-24]CDZ80904.1 hypothetical protein BN1013_01431 [Candidatus Rubidus massiliensis]
MNTFKRNVLLLMQMNPHLDLLSLNSKTSTQAKNTSDSKAWFLNQNPLPLKDLYIYGFEAGLFEVTKDWLAQDKRHFLTIIEDDYTKFIPLLHEESFKEILKNPQIFIKIFSTPIGQNWGQNTKEWENFFWIFANRVYQFLVFGKNLEKANYLKLYLEKGFKSSKEYFSYVFKWSLLEYSNFYANIQEAPKSLSGKILNNSFKNIPAIICGAGSSLEKHLTQLPNFAKKALLLAPGTSFSILAKNQINPHFSFGIDPTDKQIVRTKDYPANVPFIYTNTFNKDALKLVKGDKFLFSWKDFLSIATYLENKCGIPSTELNVGSSATYFCMNVAKWMGCNPILFIGLDLSFTNNRYALMKDDNENPITFNAYDVNHNEIKTTWDFLVEKTLIEDFALKNPKLTLINCTEGGLSIEGIPYQSFEETIKNYLWQEHPIEEKIHSLLNSHPIADKEVKVVLKDWRHNLENFLISQSHNEKVWEIYLRNINQAFERLYAFTIYQMNKTNDQRIRLELEIQRQSCFKQIVQFHLNCLAEAEK